MSVVRGPWSVVYLKNKNPGPEDQVFHVRIKL